MRRAPFAALSLLGLALLSSCQGTTNRSIPAAPGVESTVADAEPGEPAAATGESLVHFQTLWQLGDEHWPGQRTLRLSYDDGGGDVTLYIVWRIASPERYSLLAKDRLGRSWWSLAVDGSEAIAAELREGTHCHYTRAVELGGLPLGPLDFGVLPLLLVGQAPVRPIRLVGTSIEGEERHLRLQDELGRIWGLVLRDRPAGSAGSARAVGDFYRSPASEGTSRESAEVGSLASWNVARDGELLAWYEARDELHRLSSRSGGRAAAAGLQLRWKLGRLQPASQAPLPVVPPEGSVPGECS